MPTRSEIPQSNKIQAVSHFAERLRALTKSMASDDGWLTIPRCFLPDLAMGEK
jgi:hypothetical protein